MKSAMKHIKGRVATEMIDVDPTVWAAYPGLMSYSSPSIVIVAALGRAAITVEKRIYM